MRRDSASLLPTCEAVVRVSVRPVASDESHAVVRRAALVELAFWLVVDLAAAMPDLEVSHAVEPLSAGRESVQEDQSRAVRRIADTPV